jgi:hypothetical protein
LLSESHLRTNLTALLCTQWKIVSDTSFGFRLRIVKTVKVKFFFSSRCKTLKRSSKYAKFYTKKIVKYLSICKFYKKYGNTADSTENTVESSVFQSRNSHHFTSHGLWDEIKEVKFSNNLLKIWKFENLKGPSI